LSAIRTEEAAKFTPIAKIVKRQTVIVPDERLDQLCQRADVQAALAKPVLAVVGRKVTRQQRYRLRRQMANHEITLHEYDLRTKDAVQESWPTLAAYLDHVRKTDPKDWRRRVLFLLAEHGVTTQAARGSDENDRDPSSQGGKLGKRDLHGGGADLQADGVSRGYRGARGRDAFRRAGRKMLHYGLDKGDPYCPDDDGSGDAGKGTTPAHDDYGSDSGA
jgi:hypothetical protein